MENVITVSIVVLASVGLYLKLRQMETKMVTLEQLDEAISKVEAANATTETLAQEIRDVVVSMKAKLDAVPGATDFQAEFDRLTAISDKASASNALTQSTLDSVNSPVVP